MTRNGDRREPYDKALKYETWWAIPLRSNEYLYDTGIPRDCCVAAGQVLLGPSVPKSQVKKGQRWKKDSK